MSDHVLDRPVWHCLTGPQAHFAQRRDDAVRIDPSIGPFAASAAGDASGFDAWRESGPLWLVETDEIAAPPGWRVARSAPLSQMVAQNPLVENVGDEIVALDDEDAPDMARLAKATEPGPWAGATHRYGGFYGVREGDHLVAMAGTRMRPATGFAEVSGVCTDPSARGRGFARKLMMRVMKDMIDSGQTPFLHSYSTNDGAIRLYRSLGFAERRSMVVTILEAA
ncbi:Mycothiol acetyltransferase [Tsuneonella dongtanensis]|uniref:Mycothiol acetyltransferase n=1 Tax=Tsuneonella dongtanensis TaxID=692370 RepID=A0A1B2AEB1_9SPHN|nr:GNAT family N-acetyltransferase [Tsuneonella dongtanensis]ANY20441.1 Mycothiol acetyltransferase [Tsuneonella dongtanensis]